MLRKEIIVALVVIVFSAWYYWQSGYLPERSADPLGPAALPKMLAVAMIVFALAHIVVSYFRRARLADDEQPDDLTGPARTQGNLRLAAVVALTLLYILTMDPLGYALSTVIYLLLLTILLGVRSIKGLAVSSVGMTIALVLLFSRFLGVLVPEGLIEQIILH